jgi:hypothetical protein
MVTPYTKQDMLFLKLTNAFRDIQLFYQKVRMLVLVAAAAVVVVVDPFVFYHLSEEEEELELLLLFDRLFCHLYQMQQVLYVIELSVGFLG